jgi:hypothetical protein
MATEKIQTELVITNLAHGQSQQDLQGAIQAQQLLSAGPRKQVAQALAGSGALGDETQLLNAFARMLGARAGSIIRAAGTPVPTGRNRVNRRGEVLLDEEGNPIPEMQTPTVSARVRSDPNAHLSETARTIMNRRMRNKLLGTPDPLNVPTAQRMSEIIDRASAEDVSEDELLELQYQTDLFKQAQKEKAEVEREKTSIRRKALIHKTGLETYDPETGLRSFQRPLTPEQVAIHAKRIQDPLASESDKVESEFILKEEMRTRRERARHTRETSKYDQKALKEIDQIEKDVEATRKRLDTTKMRERLDAANAKLDRPGFMSMLRDVLGSKPLDFRVAPEGPTPASRRVMTPLEEQQQRYLDQDAALAQKIADYRAMPRDERTSPQGREALANIREERKALKADATEAQRQQAAEEARQRALESVQLQKRRALTDAVTGSGRDLFNSDRSIATTGLLGAADKTSDIAMTGALLTGNPLAIAGAVARKFLTSSLVGGLERGTEIQKQAEKVYIDAEPMFAREDQLRASRGLGSVKQYSREAQKRADAAQRKLTDPDLPTAGSGTPEDVDVYTNVTTKRLKILQQNLGSVMGLSAASQAYGQFRRQAGVIDMDTSDASLAMKTGYMAGTPIELLARAAQLGAIRGNVGGGIRQGHDYRTDIGTVRYQQETLERAGLMGAPAEAILGQTLSRQESMAALGMRVDFDQDAKFQRVLQESKIAPQQFGNITGSIDDMRMGLMQQLQEPGKQIMSGMMMVEAFRQGKTVQGAAEYLAKTSGAKTLQDMQTGVGLGPGLMEFVGTTLAPADQPQIKDALLKIREGVTSGPALAVGSGTMDDAARNRGMYDFMAEYSGIGGARNMTDKAKIATFQSSLDSAAKAIRSAADSMQGLVANVNAILPFGN